MAALTVLLTNKARKRELDITVYQRRAYSITCAPEPKNNFINFVLQCPLIKLAKRNKERKKKKRQKKGKRERKKERKKERKTLSE